MATKAASDRAIRHMKYGWFNPADSAVAYVYCPECRARVAIETWGMRGEKEKFGALEDALAEHLTDCTGGATRDSPPGVTA